MRDTIDFYKYYALQPQPPEWATLLTLPPFVAFMQEHNIGIGSEFGDFPPRREHPGRQAAEDAIARHARSARRSTVD